MCNCTDPEMHETRCLTWKKRGYRDTEEYGEDKRERDIERREEKSLTIPSDCIKI